MALQVGDVVNLARIAWDVYNLGWTAELRASTQYAAFGADVRHLAENLNILSNVVHRAEESLAKNGGRPTDRVRWDRASLLDIIGDYHETLAECRRLLEDNRRYGASANNPLRNIEWNALVQPSVERLRQRIQLHNSRIQNALKPFEIDLLTRIHQDLTRRIVAVHDELRQVHSELRSLIGVLVPDLKTALEQQATRHIQLLPIPPEIEHGLDDVFRLHPTWQAGQYPPLRDMSDAFISSLDQSTKPFTPGLTVMERIPPTQQYLNLLKSVFLIQRMKDSEELLNAHEQSHWPSYVMELESKVSLECERFLREMVPPPLSIVVPEALHFWIEETPSELIDTVTTKVMMEELVETSLFANSQTVSKRLRLLRHMGCHDKRYRLVLSATERQANGRPRQQQEVIDFDVTAATLNPVYILSGSLSAPFEMILQANNKIHRLAFCNLEDALWFQQGVTGFKVVDGYAEPYTKVSFVIEGQGGSIFEEASVQLWIHRRLGGSLVTDSSESPSPIETSVSPISITSGSRTMSPTMASYDGMSAFGLPPIPQDPFTADFGHMSLSSSPGRTASTSSTYINPSHPNSSPLPSAPRFPSMSPQPRTGTSHGPPLSTSPQETTRSNSLFSRIRRKSSSKDEGAPRSSGRTLSISSKLTGVSSATARSTSSSASASDTVTLALTTGETKTARIHAKPLKPMLMLFTQSARTGDRAVVALSIDEKTMPNPQRCSCQQGAQHPAGPCKITAIEQSEGASALDARRMTGQAGTWDLLPLSSARRKESRGFAGAEWRGLNRVSILFGSAEARQRFGGSFCTCPRRTEGEVLECMKKGHAGLLGQVRDYYRRQSKQWYKGRYETSVHVSDKSLNDGAGF